MGRRRNVWQGIDHRTDIETDEELQLKHKLYHHSVTFDSNALGIFLPYYVFQHPEWISARDRDNFWRALRGFISYTEDKHFKQKQGPNTLSNSTDYLDYRDERMLIFIEHLPKYANDKWGFNVAVILSTFRKEFPWYEAVLQFRRLGIEVLDDKPVWKCRDDKALKAFVNYFAWKRSKITHYRTWYEWRYGQELTDYQGAMQEVRIQLLEQAIRLSCGAAYVKLAEFTKTSWVDFDNLIGYYV